MASSIAVDGELLDWDGHPYDALGANMPFEDSFSGVFRTGWDENALYFAAEVWDDRIFVTANEDADPRSQDCLELFIDVRGIDLAFKNLFANGRSQISIDYLLVGTEDEERRIEDRDSSIVYFGGDWERKDTGLIESVTSIVKSQKAGFDVRFDGSRIQVYGGRGRSGALCDVYLDGTRVGRADLFARRSQSQQILFDSGPISPGQHTLRFQALDSDASGIMHALARPSNGAARPRVIAYDKDGTVSGGLDFARAPTERGWVIEGRIPWSQLGLSSEDLPGSIRFAYKLYDFDEAQQAEPTEVLGLRRHGSATDVSWMALNPDRFPKARLTEDAESRSADVYVTEFLHLDESWLKIEATMPIPEQKEELEEHYLRLESSARTILQAPMKPSLGGRFLHADARLPNPFSEGEPVSLSVLASGRVLDSRSLLAPGRIKAALRSIEKRLPISEIREAPAGKRELVLFYRETAMELAGFHSNIRNRGIPHYHHLPYRESREALESDISTLVAHGRLWLGDQTDPEAARLYHHQPWRSRADGSWQIFLLELPEDYDPARSYPIELRHHWLDKKYFARPEWALAAIDGLDSPAQGLNDEAAIDIHLFGRGNSFAELGDEELSRVLAFAREEFPESTRDLRLFGGSSGARAALVTASRHVDLPSLVSCSSPAIGRFADSLPPAMYDSDEVYGAFRGSIADKPRNLGNFPLKFTVGEEDEPHLSDCRDLLKNIANPRYEYGLEVVPNKGHSITEPPITTVGLEPKVSFAAPDAFEVKQDSLRYGQAYGARPLSRIAQWRPFEYSFRRTGGGIAIIKTVNLNAIHLDLDRLGMPRSRLNLLVDGSRLSLPAGTTSAMLGLEESGWSVLPGPDAASPTGVKRPALEGPIGDIEREGFAIIYGTLDPDSSDILRERAFRLAEHRIGSDEGQWSGGSFRILPDSQVDAELVASSSLWLIGGPSENAVVKRISGLLGIGLEGSAIVIGDRRFEDSDCLLEMIQPNPLNLDRYVCIEAGLSPRAYRAVFLRHRAFDFALSRVDGRSNAVLARGVFDAAWGLEEGSIIWWGDEEVGDG